MLITYFDEVKYQPTRQPYYWLAGVVVSDATLIYLEEKVNVLSEQVFGTRELLKETEFHASDLLNGHEHFGGWSMERRLQVLKQFISIFGAVERDRIGKIYCRIDVERMIKDDPQDEAFMYFIERVDGYLRSKNEAGLLIGDRESDAVASEFSEQLSRFRLHGTATATESS